MSSPAENVTTEIAPRRTPRAALPRNNTKLFESVNNRWRSVAPRDTPRERLVESDFWSTTAEQFLPYDRITVIGEARDYIAELLVLECGRGYASLVELSYTPLPALLVSRDGLPPNHSILYAGPDKLFIIKRESDSVILGEGFTTREEALAHLLDHRSLG